MTPDPERLRTLLALVAIGLRHAIANHLAAHPKAAAYDSDRTSGGHGGTTADHYHLIDNHRESPV